uniref:zinc ABC transporter substrate-binding protein ZnuA n=1 Tax=Thaumasiovibrio occultus TaxID=1891184 RepID=UPI001864F766|nr:zinc ABC transporter substrate-binding protein ZnuA [Thaumasiovibrio occultus]
MRKFYWLVLLTVFSSMASAQFSVVTTVKPLNMIVTELTQGVAQTHQLLPDGSSPHDFALRPSDLQLVKDADLFIWLGPELETFLSRITPNLDNAFALTAQPGIDFYHYEDGHDDHSHDGHNHGEGTIDPHIWLGPQQAQQVATVITAKLVELDPANGEHYQANLAAFNQNLQSISQQIEESLAPVRTNGYFVFHDAYGYFEREYGLNHLGHFTVSPDRRPGAKTLVAIKRQLADDQAVCVFKEPQFEPAVINSIVRGTEVKVGELDPVASTIPVSAGSYFVFLEQLAAQFTQCLDVQKQTQLPAEGEAHSAG